MAPDWIPGLTNCSLGEWSHRKHVAAGNPGAQLSDIGAGQMIIQQPHDVEMFLGARSRPTADPGQSKRALPLAHERF